MSASETKINPSPMNPQNENLGISTKNFLALQGTDGYSVASVYLLLRLQRKVKCQIQMICPHKLMEQPMEPYVGP
jgi:hypothetical protein